jgi:hypothetical protein
VLQSRATQGRAEIARSSMLPFDRMLAQEGPALAAAGSANAELESAEVVGSAERGPEQMYLLSLLSVAEDLLALMPLPVQRKYGLIKGTLAIKLGSAIDLKPDSCILASLTTGIQPSVSLITPPSRKPDRAKVRPGPTGDSARASVVRSLDEQLAPLGHSDGLPAPDFPSTVSEMGKPHDFVSATGSGSRVEPPRDAAEHNRSSVLNVERSMVQHHLRALRACIDKARAVIKTNAHESGIADNLAHSPAPAAVTSGSSGAGRKEDGGDREGDAAPHAVAAEAGAEEGAGWTAVEALMACSEALGTLQVVRHS